MPDILAEEDDDEGFGDFKFAPTVPAPTGRHSSFQSDDNWSGFVGFNGAGLAPSRSSPSIASNYEEKFGFCTDHAAAQQPVAIPAEPVKPKWAKPSGAIPLSIFGEDEKEEQVANGDNGPFQHGNGDLVKRDSVSKKSVGLDDLIANLLNQNRQIASADATNANLATNAENVQKKDSVIASGTVLNPDSGLNGWPSSAPEENGELDDEDDWEFMAADEKTKEEQSKAGTASDLNFNISTASWNYVNTDRLDSTSSFTGLSSANNGFGLDLVGKEKDSEVNDFDWEFRGSGVQSHPKDGNSQVNGNTKDLSMNAGVSSNVKAGVHGQNDLYVASDRISQNFGAFDFAFDPNPKAGTQASVISDSNPTSSMNVVKYDWNSNPTNGSFTSDENSWKLKDASSEICPSSQEDSKDANGKLSKPAHNVASVDPWAFQDAFSDNDANHKGNKGHQNTEKQPLPLDLFGEAQLEDSSLELPNVSSTKSAAVTSSGGAKQISSMSIRDLLSLYNQAAQNSVDTETQKSSETELHISKMMPEEESSDGVDFDDSWHFKGASPEQKDENPSFAEQMSENGVDSKQTFPEHIKVNCADVLNDDSWDFKDASLENGDEIECCKQLGDRPTLPEPITVNDFDGDGSDSKGTNLEKGHDIESTLPEPVIVKDADIFNGSWDFQGTTLENGDKIESSKQVGDELVFNWTVPEAVTASSSNVFDEDSWNFKGVSTGKGDRKEFGLNSESRTMNVDIFNDDSWNFTGASPEKGDGNPAGKVGDKGLGLIQSLTESGPTNINGVFADDSWNFKGSDPEKRDGLPVGEVGAKGEGLIQAPTGSGPTNINGVFDGDSWNFKGSDLEKGGRDLVEEVGGKGLGLNQTSPDSGKTNSDGFFDDDSWSFKGASPEKGDGLDLNGSWGFKDALSTINSGDLSLKPGNKEPHQTLCTKIELDDLIELYCNLKDEICIIAASHLDKIKEAYCGNEDAQREALDEEIQEVLNEINPPRSNPKDTHSTRTTNLNGLLIIIQEKFQILEDEYQLSRRLKSVEDGPLPLLELFRHVTLTLKILRSGSIKEHSSYVSTWKQLLSTCHQELEHGATLWKQALAKNVQTQLLSTLEGTKYFISLGEIYRAVGVLKASTKLYKPWILLNPAEFSAISASLHECSSLWSNSGLQQALFSISDPVGFEFEGTVQALLDSIRQIHSLDINTLQNHEKTICQLSLLASATIPDMKMVEWEGKNYFLKIANLWANLVSSNPPDLPQIRFS